MTSGMEELDYAGGGLKQETNWWGAFVIGLAGTILVTGIAPVMVTTLGAASIPVIIIITITGYLLCLLLAELSAMMPERTGGSPSYAYPAYRERWPQLAPHQRRHGLGVLARLVPGRAAEHDPRLRLPRGPLPPELTSGFTPIHTFIAWSTLIISIVGILLFFIPAYLGIRFGTVFATALGAALDDPADVHRGRLDLPPRGCPLGTSSPASTSSTGRRSSAGSAATAG